MKVIFAIAHSTWKEFVRDKVFFIVLLVALFILGFSYFLSTLTIIENRKIMLDFGFAAASFAGLATSVFLGVVSMAREIENRTIYTILTKPVSRASYVFGKFLGSGSVLFAVHILLSLTIWGILFLIGERAPSGFLSCMTLIFLENLIILSVAFLLSSVSSSLVSAGITISIFLIGRGSVGFQILAEKALSEEIKLLAKAIYLFFPNLERFNLREVVAYSKPFPESMLWIGFAYSFAYILFSVASCCLIFQKRDLP
jgi:ABC-type transport system involved in multi-copper enzyme maturation permease subunit